jgi:hypothetical protein
MSSNDGQRLLVFGLSFREHHTLHMQQVLQSYGRLPVHINDRGALYAGLFILSQNLSEDEAARVEDWLRNGGAFPEPQVTRDAISQGVNNNDSEDGDFWPEYHSEDFESSSEGEEIDNSSIHDEAMNDIVTGHGHHEEEEASRSEHGWRDGQDADDELDGDELDEDDGNHPPFPPHPSPEVARLRPIDPLMTEAHSEVEAVRGRPFDPLDGPVRFSPSPDPEEPRTSESEIASLRPVNNGHPADGNGTECTICCSVYGPGDFPSPITPNCKHRGNEAMCIYCLQRYIAESIADGEVTRIWCPYCEQKLGPKEVKTYATAEVFARYPPILLLL